MASYPTEDDPEQHLPIFVYGTLQRGEERAPLWPHPATSIRPAWIRGELYDLGPYPALTPGDDRVEGELWDVSREHLEDTLRVLDQIEGFAGRSDDWYVRRLVRARIESPELGECIAFTYFFNQALEAAGARRVAADPLGRCSWHRGRRCRDPFEA